ncbi:MAG: Gfo/Idh/MocA family oxidoreductase [Clostridia bacterium]|nr:Gfo/Idh/MocA family oxidoreductase [Clostridia bacterium]
MFSSVIIGCGGIATAHSDAYKLMNDVKVSACVDVVREKADKMASEHNCKAYYSVDDMLKHEKPDMVDICVPSYMHKDIAIQCMESGINTLCEKPIANNMEDAEMMVAKAKDTGVHFMIAQIIRFMPEYKYLIQLKNKGTYGKLKNARFYRICQAPIWGSGWYTSEKSGKAPFELHIHDTDFINYFMGMPKEVHSIGYEDPENNNSYLSTRYIYGDVVIEGEGAWYAGPIPFSMRYQAVFDKAVVEFTDNVVTVYPAIGEAFKPELHGIVDIGSNINLKNAGGIYNEIRYFVECVRTGNPIETITPQESLCSLKILLTEIESARSGKALPL